ncbi:MAG: hypothetical protein ABJH04_13265 [Cyclobacteriaceae bacterium]
MTQYFKSIKFQFLVLMLGLLIAGCESDDPQKEDTPELITKATLTFTPVGGGTVVTATATDPDGEGVQDIAVDGAINLTAGVNYTLSLSLINELAEVTSPEYNITEEVEEEGDEHMFFFAWTGDVFSDPSGNGNIDNRADAVNYEDEDEGGLPIGIVTSWTAGAAASSGTFRIVLKHQPDLKTSTSGSDTGESDLDIEFEINVN